MEKFNLKDLKRLYKPKSNSSKEDNGQVVIIGGSSLFHGAPILALKTASRLSDMVFFASPEPSLGEVAAKIKGFLSSFIWVPWEEVEEYIKKADACLIGPGFMRYHQESQRSKVKSKKVYDEVYEKTKEITENLFEEFPKKRWVVDAGSLQVVRPEVLPKGAIITPNKKEYQMLFGKKKPEEQARKYKIIIVYKKGPQTIICSPKQTVLIKGGNVGLTKGGTGDVLAGVAVALLAKNDPFLSACAASYVVKKAAEVLYSKVGFVFSADDLASEVPKVLGKYYREGRKRKKS